MSKDTFHIFKNIPDSWYRRMAELEDGCDVSAGAMTLEELELEVKEYLKEDNKHDHTM